MSSRPSSFPLRALRPRSSFGRRLERFSRAVALTTGSSWAFAVALAVVLLWMVTGPLFHFSDTWQLVINTGTTIVTFLMVFLIQRAQNKDALAIHLKLNEVVAAIQGASNRLIDVESLSEAELERLHAYYEQLARMAKKEVDLRQSHSVEEAERRHRKKQDKAGRQGTAPHGDGASDSGEG